ncbi:hypothetical protein PMZ80_002491 [Knufia obscura]|uniref:Uncharacterized protein n=1 Tax=Knufia obscura TaxID=1635080 RepID=A0ABR0RXG4_9EURO|nr:hypothetical protein PMZ80_002491 [Knufia obscura]
MRPDQRAFYHQHATQLQSEALAGFNAILQALTESNIVAAFLVSSLIGMHVFCDIFLFRVDSNHSFNSILDSLIGCINLLRGVRSVIDNWWDFLCKSELSPILVTAEMRRKAFMNEESVDLKDLNRMIDTADVGVASKEAYKQAVKELEHVFAAQPDLRELESSPSAHIIFAWLVTVPKEYVDLLSARRPEALVILSYYAANLHYRRKFWAINDAGEYLIHNISSHLGKHWEQWLAWPQQLLRVVRAQKKRFSISIVLDPSNGFTRADAEIRSLRAVLVDLSLQLSQIIYSQQPPLPSTLVPVTRTGVLPTIQPRTPPDWKFEDQFEFYGFWLPNEELIVSNALTGVMDLLETTMKVLSGTSGEGEEDPSFQRYFRKGDLDQVGAIFQRVLAVLGAPGTSAIRQCIEASKLLLIYGDGPNSNRNCADERKGVFAYYNAFEDENKIPRSYMSFCKRFFDNYKAHKPMDWDPSIPYVDSAKMGTTIDIADRYQLPEAESGASIVLHELLHWSDITKPVVPNQIEDLALIRPDTQEQRTAYRSFYGAKVKDPAWKATQPPTENADTYVYMVPEIFYRYRSLEVHHENTTQRRNRLPFPESLFGRKTSKPSLEKKEADIGQPDPFPREPWPAGANYFEFHQFPSEEHKQAVLYSMIEIQDILSTAVRILSQEAGKQEVANPSFRRYFFPTPGDLRIVLGVFQSVLAKIGCPRYDTLLQCPSMRKEKLVIYYEDPPYNEDPRVTCKRGGHWAFVGKGDGTGNFNYPRYMSICGRWFSFYRGAKCASAAMLGNVIDPGCQPQWQQVTWSATMKLLHELMHLDYIYQSVLPKQIDDIVITFPAPDGRKTQAQGAYCAMHVKDWSGGKSPTLNADSYVFTAKEIYYTEWKKQENIVPSDWVDSPDIRIASQQECPRLVLPQPAPPPPVAPPRLAR